MIRSRPLTVTLAVLAVLAAAVIGLAAVWDWSWFRGPATRAASAVLGRQVTVAGDISLDLGLTTRIVLNDVAIANAPWGKAGRFATAKRVEATIRLPDLIHGRVDIPELVLVQPRVSLERNAKGDANWTFDDGHESSDAESPPPLIRKVRIEDGTLGYRDARSDSAFDVAIATADATPGIGDGKLILKGTGRYLGKPFDLTLKAGSIYRIDDTVRPFPVDLDLTLGGNTAKAQGTLTAPLEFSGADLDIDLKGPDAAEAAAVAGYRIPKTPAYALKGRLIHKGESWSLGDFTARFGNSDLAGNLAFNEGEGAGARPKLTGTVVSDRFDLDDFSAFTGPDDTAGKEAPAAGPEQKPATPAAAQPVIPDVDLDIPALKAFDADVGFTVKQIANTPARLESLDGHVVLAAGKLTLKDIRLAAGGSSFSGSATLDTSARPATASVDAQMRKLDLGLVLPKDAAEDVSGRLGGRVDLKGEGASLAALLKTLKGRVTLFLGGGKLNALLADAAGLDVLGTLRNLAGDRKATTRIRCMVADFDVKSGVMKSNALVMDTDFMVLTGGGTISLPKETLDLTLTPRSRSLSPLSFSTPLSVFGSFRNPAVAPKATGLGTQAGTTLALGLFLGPMAALVPMIQDRLAGDGDCGALLKDARSSGATSIAPGDGGAGKGEPKNAAPAR